MLNLTLSLRGGGCIVDKEEGAGKGEGKNDSNKNKNKETTTTTNAATTANDKNASSSSPSKNEDKYKKEEKKESSPKESKINSAPLTNSTWNHHKHEDEKKTEASSSSSAPAAANTSTARAAADDEAEGNNNNNNNNTASAATAASGGGGGGGVGATKEEENGTELQGRQRFIEDIGATVMTVGERSSISTLFILTSPRNSKHGLTLVFLNQKTEKLYVAEISDEELTKQKVAQSVSYAWSALFKSMTSDTLKHKTKVHEGSNSVSAEFAIISVRDKTKIPFKLHLAPVKCDIANRHKYILEPMSRMVQKRRQVNEEREREMKVSRLQTLLQLQEFSIAIHRATIDRLKPMMSGLREEAARYAKISAEFTANMGRYERKIKLASRGQVRNELDDMYENGGARSFPHLPQAETHIPADGSELLTSPNTEYISEALVAVGDKQHSRVITPTGSPVGDERLSSLYNSCKQEEIEGILTCMQKLDDWDYNIFEAERATCGNALFYTTYAIMAKLNLIKDLKLDDKILRRFLMSVQSGYHPNPYHNSTHAADVAQINYFILCRGGLADKCNLSKEELFAAIMAGAIHDYDHPGFNNSFHTRTNAYLSTLYNDRSVLENHHVACTFELLRKKELNVLSHMAEDQRNKIRETMIEIVLATDMGLHGKIFGHFRRRLPENPDWGSKEDKPLALSMAIKMADTSNCGRPNHLYVEWAKNIANEFYHQGDVEGELCLPISPYMDRRKEKEEFPKGQVFFMNVVVLGMFEKMAELLPALDVAVRFCSENKEYWQQMDS